MTEDFKEEVKESLEISKPIGKLQKLSEKVFDKINRKFEGEREFLRKRVKDTSDTMEANIKNFVEGTNADLEKFRKRYENLYSDLVRRILVRMESRLFSVELFEQASLDLLVEKMYRLENNLASDVELDHIAYQAYIEDCAEKHQKLMQKAHDNFVKKQKENDNVEPVQEENQDQDSTGTEDQAGDQVNTEHGGAANQQDGGVSEQTPVV